ncbi:MAG: PseG/SpsG family protein [bacterium]
MAKALNRQTIAFRVDAEAETGFGHLKRCLVLARALQNRARVMFLSRHHDQAAALLNEARFEVETVPPQHLAQKLRETIATAGMEMLVIDLKQEVNRNDIESLRKMGVTTVLLDNAGDGRHNADVVIYPAAHVDAQLFAEISGKLYFGWEYAIIDNRFFGPRKTDENRLNILVSMGGSDVNDATSKALAALKQIDRNFQCTVVVGPGFRTRHFDCNDGRFIFKHNVSDLSELMLSSDMGVILFGGTAYEAAAAGLPCAILADPHNLQALKRFSQFETCLNLGNTQEAPTQHIVKNVQTLIAYKSLRKRLSKNGRSHAVPGGAERIAEILLIPLREGVPAELSRNAPSARRPSRR